MRQRRYTRAENPSPASGSRIAHDKGDYHPLLHREAGIFELGRTGAMLHLRRGQDHLTNYGIVKTWPGAIVSIALRTEPTAPQGTPAARQERGSLRWLLVQPWVYERDAETGEVLYIARHQRQVVLKRGRRDHAVRNTRRGAPQLAAGHRERPSVRQWLASPERTRSANHSGTVTLMKFPS
jgi:hypothetical protein